MPPLATNLVDPAAKDLGSGPDEKITEGLRERLTTYYQLGARFAKWLAVIKIGEGIQ
jgi:fructose-bisphosphate aldolase, class I